MTKPLAIFFDLGGTLWDDYPTELYQWEYLAGILADYGVSTSLDDFIARSWGVIDSYCPSLTRALVFQLLGGNEAQYREAIDRLIVHTGELFEDAEQFRRLNPLFPGVHELLDALAGEYKLAVVSQHFGRVQHWMTAHGLGPHFQHLSLSGREKLYKPDPRIFLHCCAGLGIEPAEALMVGDRLDNDIWPAKRLGMQTVRVLSDPYRVQRPRYHGDVPDHVIERIADLQSVLQRLGD